VKNIKGKVLEKSTYAYKYVYVYICECSRKKRIKESKVLL